MRGEANGEYALRNGANASATTPSIGSRSMVKRAMDIIIAGSALIFLSPMMLIVALIIKLTDGGPALFKQKRIGLNGDEFTCLKFRSMVMNANEELERLLSSDADAAAEWAKDQKLRNDPRITAIGSFLRKTSLDELPQLLNVLQGTMSIVGPRPIVRGEVEKYGAYITDYASVRPGITGLWQISGRNDTSYDERVSLDVEYARNWAIEKDVKIFLFTIPAVLFSKGAY